jgi:hypothetical protein
MYPTPKIVRAVTQNTWNGLLIPHCRAEIVVLSLRSPSLRLMDALRSENPGFCTDLMHVLFQIADKIFADPLLFGYYTPSILTIYHLLLQTACRKSRKQGSPDPVRFCYSDAVATFPIKPLQESVSRYSPARRRHLTATQTARKTKIRLSDKHIAFENATGQSDCISPSEKITVLVREDRPEFGEIRYNRHYSPHLPKSPRFRMSSIDRKSIAEIAMSNVYWQYPSQTGDIVIRNLAISLIRGPSQE